MEIEMTKKRRKISEVFEEVQKINNWKPSQKDLEDLNEALKDHEEVEKDLPIEKVAIANVKDNLSNGIEQSRI
jgi:hypothetical protein